MTYREEADGRGSFLDYDGEATVPSRRSDFKAFEPNNSEPQPSSVAFHIEKDMPAGFTRTTKGRNGVDVITSVKKDRDGKWVDGLGGRFDSLWFDAGRKTAYLSANEGRTWFIMHHDGQETVLQFDAGFWPLSRVLRNELGEVIDFARLPVPLHGHHQKSRRGDRGRDAG